MVCVNNKRNQTEDYIHFEENKIKKFYPSNVRLVVYNGIFYGLSNIAIVYASDPKLTPIIVQAIFSGLGILPSCVLTKFYLKKNIRYNYKYIILSLMCVIASLLISIIPEYHNFQFDTFYWSMIFIFGIFCRTLSAIYQEKYFMITKDYTSHNKIINLFYARISQFITICLFFILGYILDYPNDHAPDDLYGSLLLYVSFGKTGILLQVFIIAYFLFCGFSIYLNSISVNYNMVACVSISPTAVIFFTIFPEILVNTIVYPVYITIPALGLSICSIYFWYLGESFFKNPQQNELIHV